jgi:hypothetical protein
MVENKNSLCNVNIKDNNYKIKYEVLVNDLSKSKIKRELTKEEILFQERTRNRISGIQSYHIFNDKVLLSDGCLLFFYDINSKGNLIILLKR